MLTITLQNSNAKYRTMGMFLLLGPSMYTIRTAIFLTCSIMLHLTVLFLLSERKSPQKPAVRQKTIKLRIIPAATKPTVEVKQAPPAAAPEKTMASIPTEKRPTKTSPTSSPGQQPGTPKLRAYADLFPKPAHESSDSPTKNSISIRSYDSENSNISVETHYERSRWLEQFAKELVERISIPRSMIRLVGKGDSYLRFTKKNEEWGIKRLSGNRYLRAVLFNTIDPITRESYLGKILDQIEYRSIRIYLTYSVYYAHDKSPKPLKVRIVGNKVLLDLAHLTQTPAWDIATPVDNENSDDGVALNLIGLGKMFVNMGSGKDAFDDIDAKRLRLSPGYLKPILRIK